MAGTMRSAGCSYSATGSVRPLVAQLKRDGINVQLVSGDSEFTTAAVAKDLGVEAYLAEV
jgi:cation transport ATPase